LNLHEIPVGVPRRRCSNVALVDVSDFRISMRRASRFVDACHVVSPASHSCRSALKGRHVMPFNQSLCRSLPKRSPTHPASERSLIAIANQRSTSQRAAVLWRQLKERPIPVKNYVKIDCRYLSVLPFPIYLKKNVFFFF